MADVWINFTSESPRVGGDVKGGGEVREHEFAAEFSVKVTYPGCYAIAVWLINHHSPPFPDTVVGYPSGADLKCYCFTGQQERTFFVGAAGSAPKGKTALKPSNPSPETLDPIEGTWPSGDFPTDRMQLMVEVKVYECHRGDCVRGPHGEECKDNFRTSSLHDADPVGERTKKDAGRTTIHPGDLEKQLVEGAKEAIGVGAKVLPLPK